MKILAFILALLIAPFATEAQTVNTRGLSQRIQELEDKAAIKKLVDTFSILADQKDVAKQLLLFTEDATVESISNGRPSTPFKGREQIGKAFTPFLANFQTVYHINGQQTVELAGDKATGVSYCLVVLIGVENGKTFKTTMGVIYDDEYVRRGTAWLIAKRVSNFTWRDREEMQPPST